MQCRQCQAHYLVSSEDLAFYESMSPTFAGKKYPIPNPTLCPPCRRQRRLSFRNENKLYSRKCDQCQKDIISIYSPDKEQAVYCMKCWWSEKHVPTDFGRDYDFNRPFFVQLTELLKKTPLPNLIATPDAEESNCAYVNCAGHNNNCYMIFDADHSEDSLYSNAIKASKNTIDCSYIQMSELCYQCVDCTQCYNLLYSQDCANCRDSYFLKNCISCNHCILCVNLQHKEYCIMNQQYSKEDYEQYVAKLNLGNRDSIPALYAKLKGFAKEHANKFFHGHQAENSSGDYLYNVKNCRHCFMTTKGEDLTYCDSLIDARHSCDISSFGENMERCYESNAIGDNVYEVFFSQLCAGNIRNVYFNLGSRNSHDCFGCIALKSNEYCILNKQYSKDDYEKMVARIIEHMLSTGGWGEGLPMFMSPFGYNESMANIFFPLTKEAASKLGAKWKDEVANTSSAAPVTVPADIKVVTDTIINEVLTCSSCQKKYKLVKQELQYYRDHNVPVPINCFDCRYRMRLSMRNPQKLWDSHCQKCGVNFETSYDPAKEDLVYCEKCYLENVH
ncbi:MAG: hypothetical protein HY817_04135 [Candidatus Abawacabacteria bacterium]|nr:hypothetical protein [Candidatus Abawacabacteria bacterium]